MRFHDRIQVGLQATREGTLDGTAYLRVTLARHHARALRFPDGRTLRPGDQVAVLHFHDEAVRQLGLRARSPNAAGFALRRVVEESLRVLAVRLASDPRFAGVRAVSALTDLWRGAQRLGLPRLRRPRGGRPGSSLAIRGHSG
jgi:hypothetical protein